MKDLYEHLSNPKNTNRRLQRGFDLLSSSYGGGKFSNDELENEVGTEFGLSLIEESDEYLLIKQAEEAFSNGENL